MKYNYFDDVRKHSKKMGFSINEFSLECMERYYRQQEHEKMVKEEINNSVRAGVASALKDLFSPLQPKK